MYSFDTANSVRDSFSVANVGAGLLGFDFYSNTISMGINNGSNNDLGSFQSFATISDFTYDGTFYDAIVLFDDSSAGPDDDGDDHIIGIRAVPEPAIIALFATGLLGIGFARRRKAQLITTQ